MHPDPTLQSLFGQTRPVEQIIVWDDGSVDGTEDAVKPLVRDNLTYHRAPNAGKSSALNQAMKFVKGDYVWICDDDDLLLPHAADTLAGILDEKQAVGSIKLVALLSHRVEGLAQLRVSTRQLLG